MQITFFSRREPYFEFSNFYTIPIELDGMVWRSTEHYYQAARHLNDPVLFNRIQGVSSPKAAKVLSRSRQIDPKEWEARRDKVMLKALRAKFTQHPRLRAMLLSTGDAELVERSRDRYWGRNSLGGKNRLGELLMQVREELKNG